MPAVLTLVETVTELGVTVTEIILESASAPGPAGADGVGVPAGGTTGQVLAKATNTDYDTEWADQTGGGGGAPTTVDYLVGTASGSLSAEIVVGTAPGGELGGTWASPTVDAVHSGSSHASVQAAAEATAAAALAAHEADTTDAHDASAISIADVAGDFIATDVEGALAELQADAEADATDLANHLADTADAHDASAISFSPTGTIAATDVQAAIAEVASEAGGGGSQPSIVTSLPGSPSDNDEVYLQVGTGDTAVLWHLKYDADITDAYKWRFLGGAPLHDLEGTGSMGESGGATTTSGTYVELDSGQPRVTLPYTGVYDISWGAQVGATAATAYGLVGLKINGSVPANDNEDLEFRCNAGSASWTNAMRQLRKTIASISTSADIIQVYRTDGNTQRFTQRWISVLPVRIG